MIKKVFLILVFGLLLISFSSADLIEPGYRYIEVENRIVNINDFSDYDFLTVCSLPMPSVMPVGSEGEIGLCYKFSKLDVYAARKTDINLTHLHDLMKSNRTKAVEYFVSLSSVRVLSDLEHQRIVPITSTEKGVANYYNINLNDLSQNLHERSVKRNNLIYFYIIAPIVALMIIIFILIRRKNGSIN